MPREPLREEEISRAAVDVGDRRMAQGMKRIEPVEPGLHLPRPEGELNPPRRDPAPSALCAEERITGCETVAYSPLLSPESP